MSRELAIRASRVIAASSSVAARKPIVLSSRAPRKKPTPLSAFFDPVRRATQR